MLYHVSFLTNKCTLFRHNLVTVMIQNLSYTYHVHCFLSCIIIVFVFSHKLTVCLSLSHIHRVIPLSDKPCLSLIASKLNRLCWFGHVQRMEENSVPKRVLYMNLETTRFRGRPRNRWQDELREDGRIVDGEVWQEKVCNREEWKTLLSSLEQQGIVAFCTCRWNE